MAISQAMCTSFKQEILVAEHDFTTSTGDAFHIALFTSSATLSATTTVYDGTNEVPNGNGYITRGEALTNVTPTTTGTTAWLDFNPDITWTSSTITANGAQIFNEDHASDASVVVLEFGGDKSSSSGDFTVQFPAADSTNAIIRIA